MEKFSPSIEESINSLANTLTKFSSLLKQEKKMFYLSHGEWRDDHYVITKEKMNIGYKTDEDLILSKEKYEKYVTTIIEFLTEKEEFFTKMAFDDFQGIQWDFDNEPRIKEMLMTSADKGNFYHQDLLLFEALKKRSFSKDPKVIKANDVAARQIFSKIKDEDQEKIPNIYIYRAALFDDYKTLVEKEGEDLWDVLYEWNLNVKDAYIELKKLELADPKFKKKYLTNESFQLAYWLVEKFYIEMKYIPQK